MAERSRKRTDRLIAFIAGIALVAGLIPAPALADPDPAEPSGRQAPATATAEGSPGAESPAGGKAGAPGKGAPAEERPGAAAPAGEGPKAAAPAGEPSEAAAPAEEPSEAAAPAAEPSEGAAPAEEPSETAAPAGEPSQAAAPAEEPSEEAAPAEEPSGAAVPAAEPSEAGAPAEEPSEAAAPAEGGEAGFPAFRQSRTAGGVTVTVEAAAGAFPGGAALSVASVPSSRTEEAVSAERGEGENVAASYTFDIKVLDADGEEVQPRGGKAVKVSFRASEVADPNLDVSVYHVSGGAAEELAVSESGSTATAESDGFSYYTVEFTYGDLQYVLWGGSEVALADILSAVGLVGEPTGVEVSDPELFSASGDSGAWVVSYHQAFTSEEWMRVTIAGAVYKIVVVTAVIIDEGECGWNAHWTLDKEETLTISCVPGQYEGNIHTPTYSDYGKTIKKIIIDEGITAIGLGVFKNCTSLTSVVIPDSVTSIGSSAFFGCTSLESVTIPDSVKSIGDSAFFGCSGLASVVIPDSVTCIEKSAFCECTSLTSVVIPDSVTSIGALAFESCSKLKDIYYSGSPDQWNAINGSSSIPSGATVHYPCAVAVSANPTAGGTVSVSPGQSAPACAGGKYWSGTLLTLTAAPGGGYVFANWTEAGPSPEGGPSAEGGGQGAGGATQAITENPYTFEVKSDRELTANFEPKRKITITAASDKKEYDGNPLVNPGVAVTSGSLAEGDTLVAEACGSATYTGDTDMGNNPVAEGYKVMRGAEDVTGEYDIAAVAGTLTIEQSTKVLRIASADGEWAYDGLQHSKYKYKVRYGGDPVMIKDTKGGGPVTIYWLATGDNLIITNYAESAEEVGTYANAFAYELDHPDQYANVEVVVGKLVIYGVESSYKVVSGDDATFVPGSGAVLPFTFKNVEDDSSTFDLFAGAEVDGTTVPKGGYIASKGSVVVELQPSFLETLSPGAHTITALFDDGGSATANFTVSAPSKHTVTFDANGHGTAPDAQEVVHGEKAKRPKDPTASGYTFGGWYADKACTSAYDFSTPVTGDITLYAKWTAVHTVTFDRNGHGTAPDAQEVVHGEKAKRPKDPTASGYTFGGWYTDKDCKNAYNFSTPVTENITLYAKWTAKSSSKSSTSPKTGDPLGGALAIALALAAASALALAVSRRRTRD